LNLIITTGSLVGTIQGGGFGILGLAMAALQGYGSYDQLSHRKTGESGVLLMEGVKALMPIELDFVLLGYLRSKFDGRLTGIPAGRPSIRFGALKRY
jgi:hypothetical protein